MERQLKPGRAGADILLGSWDIHGAEAGLIMDLQRLKVRKTTSDRLAAVVGGSGLTIAFLLALWTFFRGDKAESAAIGFGITAIMSFFGLLAGANSRKDTNTHSVEQFRPYLVSRSEDNQLWIENIGRGIAFEVTLYTASPRKRVRELGIITSGAKSPVSVEVAKLIGDQGIKIAYTCQLGRTWGTSVGPAVSNFAPSFMEFEPHSVEEQIP